MQVLKFGGTSVGTTESIQNVLALIKSRTRKKSSLVAVFSAFQGITDQLIRMGKLAARGDSAYEDIFKDIEKRHIKAATGLISIKKQSKALTQLKIQLNDLEEVTHGVFLVKELTPKTLDYIMSFGERLSCLTISSALSDISVANHFLDTREIIKTDNEFGSAKVFMKETTRIIKKHFEKLHGVVVATGFIASTRQNETTTLGRGGSDYTASLFGAILGSDEIEIWTDVDGVLTADPRKVKNAFAMESLTYEEAMELSHFGARVIYPPTMQPALDRKIPIRVKNTFNPDFPGTVISATVSDGAHIIKGISSIDEIALIRVQGSGMIGVAGIARRIFHALAEEKINIILISQASSEHSICLAIPPRDTELAKKALKTELKYELRDKIVSEISVEKSLAIIAVVGENMRRKEGLAGRVFQALGKNGVNIVAIAQGSSELNISMVISRVDEAKALNALHDEFFLSKTKTVNLFLVGFGLIGKTLLSLISKQKDNLAADANCTFKLVGLANSKKMILHETGIDHGRAATAIAKSSKKSDIKKYISQMRQMNMPNSVFLDCTAEDSIAKRYPDILSTNVSIVAANKKANVRPIKEYRKLRRLAADHNSRFLYETNVGAALPVINTIQDLVASGDKVLRIEGIFSGTLSFIFNRYNAREPFSEIVRQAQDKGLTEPDPSEDLSGMDVARKLLILVREAGFKMELSDVVVENLLQDRKGKGEFYSHLKKADRVYADRYQQAHKSGNVLRYAAKFDGEHAKVGLREFAADHMFAHISDNENIVAIYTNNYGISPLIIRGPGAGAEVTAAGVLADILRLIN